MARVELIISTLVLLLLFTFGFTAAKNYIPKTLIYITTHMSEDHKQMFKNCWPLALKNSRLLNSSNIMIYMTPKANEVKESIHLIKKTFKNHNFNIYISVNKGWNEGAMAALTQGEQEGFFDGYEWVFRMNPDVMLQSDKWFLETMKNDKGASLFYVECQFEEVTFPGVKALHTDFFAFKPGSLPTGIFQHNPDRSAEISFTMQMKPLIEANKHRQIPNAHPEANHVCHIDGNMNAPIYHYHEYFINPRKNKGKSVCPAIFSASENDVPQLVKSSVNVLTLDKFGQGHNLMFILAYKNHFKSIGQSMAVNSTYHSGFLKRYFTPSFPIFDNKIELDKFLQKNPGSKVLHNAVLRKEIRSIYPISGVSGYNWLLKDSCAELLKFNWRTRMRVKALMVKKHFRDFLRKPSVGFHIRRGDKLHAESRKYWGLNTSKN